MENLQGINDQLPLTDPRKLVRKHSFFTIISLGIIGAISGMNNWVAIADFAHSKYDILKHYFDLTNGLPSHDTIQRIFTRLDPDEFAQCFMQYTQLLSEQIQGVIAVDGKTMCGTSKNDQDPLHVVSAWSEANKLVLAQFAAQGKGQELSLIPILLSSLNLAGQIVTIDALGCQKSIAEQIIEQGGDYILAVKGNQKTLHEDIIDYFDEETIKSLVQWQEIDKAHGRIETRECFVSEDIGWMQGHKWRNLKSIVMLRSTILRGDKESKETRYFITSLAGDAKKIGRSIREHWGIENKVHWVLDVTMNEDKLQVYVDNGPENMSILNKFALNFANKYKDEKMSIKRFQQKMATSDLFLERHVKKI